MEGRFGAKKLDWDMGGLPSIEDLTPLTQTLISPELALAFGITQERPRVSFDLNRTLHDNCSTICPREENDPQGLRLFPADFRRGEEEPSRSGSEDGGGGPGRAGKRPRLVWTPQLHKRFVDVIEHLGVDKAVPKTIMEMMSVEGLTRENVASHLQKYRLYLKRIEGLSSEGHPVPRRPPTLFECDGFGPGMVPSPNPPQQHLMPVPGPPGGPYGFGHLGYCGLESANMFWNRH